jgi:hypothetical protein
MTPPFLSIVLNKGEWLTLGPGRCNPRGKKPLGTRWFGGWVGLKTNLEKRKLFCPCRYLNHDCEQVMYKALTAVFHCLIWTQNSVAVT